ncbi:MAG: hypothetical protein ABJE95_04985 [Byssovorax sp.]
MTTSSGREGVETAPREWTRRARWLWASAAIPLLSACAAEAPPLEALPLRDALTAEPDVIASMPDVARRELAERLEDPDAASAPIEAEAEAIPHAIGATTADEVRTIDDAREARGDDVVVLSALERGPRGAAIRALRLARAPDADPDLPALEGPEADRTIALEQRALDGQAGRVLTRILTAQGAHHLVRVTGWPVGAVASGDVVYVNASWLVAMASLEKEGSRGGPSRPATPVLHPLSLGGNPYLTYATIEACVADVGQRCTSCVSSGACDDPPALSDFTSARAECDFLAKDPKHTEELCALALLSIPAFADCVRRSAPTCPIPSAPATSSGLSAADPFLTTAGCSAALDVCISGAPDTSGSGGNVTLINVDTSGCTDPFTACASSCKGLSDGCKSGSCSGSNNQSCTSCSGNSGSSSCSSCSNSSGSSSCGSCSKGSSGTSSGSSCGSSGKGCKCEQSAAAPAPFGSIAWLLAPLGFLYVSARRRS